MKLIFSTQAWKIEINETLKKKYENLKAKKHNKKKAYHAFYLYRNRLSSTEPRYSGGKLLNQISRAKSFKKTGQIYVYILL